MTFKPNTRGLDDLLCGAEMQAVMGDVVEKGRLAAEAIAPVGPESDPHRGDYKDSFETDVRVEKPAPRAWGGPRAVGRLTNTTPYAVAVEYGTGGRSAAPTDAAHHVLTRAIDGMKG